MFENLRETTVLVCECSLPVSVRGSKRRLHKLSNINGNNNKQKDSNGTIRMIMVMNKNNYDNDDDDYLQLNKM